ncbi:MAG TPA: hypothetical protein VNJ53_03280 [Gaiellaceae bacterium]|nr:hypothetical protein [Gaiellaceae bacterium]
MKRRFVVVAAAAACAAAVLGSARAASVYGYSAAGEWFSPGEAYSGPYDHACGPWVSNHFSKAEGAWGLITFIDPNGNWRRTKQGGGWLRDYLSAGESSGWRKKPHCKNNAWVPYQGGCFGMRESFSNCV